MRRSKFVCGLFSGALVLLSANASRAQEGGAQRYPLAYVDRPLTLPSITISPDVSFDATQLVKDPNAAERTFQTDLSLSVGALVGITDDLEVRGSVGTIRIAPKFEYLEPRIGVTYRFVGAEQLNMGIRAEITALTLPGEGGVRMEASLPFLVRLGSSARMDFAPGAPVTIQENKAAAFGLNAPFAFAFQIVEPIHIGARTSVRITDFADPLGNLVIPLGFFLGISLGSERPIVEINPYFTWTEFATPGAKAPNDPISIETFTAGASARIYLFL